MDNNPTKMAVPIAQLYEQVRAQIQHEDNLVTQRLNWFLTSQSFLFTAFAIVFNGVPPVSEVTTSLRLTLLRVIPFIAITAGLLIFLAIFAGAIVMRNLRLEFAVYRSAAQEAGLPPLQGRAITRVMGLLAPIGLPVVFTGVWFLLLARMFG